MKSTACVIIIFGMAWSLLVVPAKAQDTLKIHVISGSDEYESEKSLKSYNQYLTENHPVTITASWVEDRAQHIPGTAHIPEADLLLVFCRRLQLPKHQMNVISRHWEKGKPVIALRTASHAFDDQTNEVFDHKVLGGNYQGHLDDRPVLVEHMVPTHPVLKGVAPFTSRKLYLTGELAPDALVLQVGKVQGEKAHPVTWVHTFNGGRMFYTSLGVPADFEDPNFRLMLTNAIFWTTSGE